MIEKLLIEKLLLILLFGINIFLYIYNLYWFFNGYKLNGMMALVAFSMCALVAIILPRSKD